MVRTLALALLLAGASAGQALAWGFEGHEVVAAIALNDLTPAVRAKVDQMLAADIDTLAPHDLLSQATWADRYRGAGHPETGSWHFVDIEIDHPDLKEACFDFPSSGAVASQGPAQDCVVDKLEAFTRELADPVTAPSERLLALKYVLHFVGDIHQPLHAADNHDRGGNCVLLSLGGPRSVNLHSYWDTAVVQALGTDPQLVADQLLRGITPSARRSWQKGNPKAWAMESYGLAKSAVYTFGSKAGCGREVGPVDLPAGYDSAAQAAARLQLERAGIRLAWVLNRSLAR